MLQVRSTANEHQVRGLPLKISSLAHCRLSWAVHVLFEARRNVYAALLQAHGMCLRGSRHPTDARSTDETLEVAKVPQGSGVHGRLLVRFAEHGSPLEPGEDVAAPCASRTPDR